MRGARKRIRTLASVSTLAWAAVALVGMSLSGAWSAQVKGQTGLPGHDGLEAPIAGFSCEAERPLRVTRPPLVGNDVLELRNRLRILGYRAGDVADDRYDADLAVTVRQLQRDKGLSVDGIVGRQTWDALAADVHVPATAPVTTAPTGDISIVIDTNHLTLTIYSDGQPFKTYPVAVGRPRTLTLTPVGEWRVINKGLNWGGGFGTRWIGINVPWGIYGIHGTDKPYSIGTRASAGCIRMFNRDVEELYPWVPLGTPVRIVGVKPPVDFGRVLKVGATGPDVVEVQLRLNEAGFVHGDADGRFGPATKVAVERMQRTYGLSVDGEVWTDMYYILGLK